MTGTTGPDWAWAILDRIITPDKTGFLEHHTIAIAETPDPARDAYLHEPERARHVHDGFPDYYSHLNAWGWTTVSDFAPYPTKVRKPTNTRTSFGAIQPYRGVARVRRTGIGTAKGTAEPVPYGDELAVVFQPVPWPSFGQTTAHPDTIEVVREMLPTLIREQGLPIAGIDPYPVCCIVAEQVAQHPDETFKAECVNLAAALNARGDIDPEHAHLIAGTLNPV
jgi:hypothetical protein